MVNFSMQRRRERIGRGRKQITLRGKPRNDEHTDLCPLCKKAIKGYPGAKVYHWECLYASMEEVRNKTKRPTDA